ncbi:MAG TPA: response regulator transcription factor [Bacteroidales bacterium]|nr:response regulator transcription factor [Bacteroidales bacterium]
MKKASILLVEDDPNLSMVLQDYLEMLNYSTTLATNGVEGIQEYRNGKFDLCILDVMMPKMDGFTLAEEIRRSDEFVPIIFLTAKSLKEDRIKGFHTGCDDYIPKPFSTEELSLRIQAILKRSMNRKTNTIAENEVFKIGNYTFEPGNMSLTWENGSRSLTRKETSLLKILCQNKDKLIPREFILKEIWGTDDYFLGRSMDVFIAKLRKYLSDDPNLSITNVHGTGFKFETDKQD